MANEYLQRTPTSTGNRKVWTWSAWAKRNNLTDSSQHMFSAGSQASNWGGIDLGADEGLQFINVVTSVNGRKRNPKANRDSGSWIHYFVSVDTTRANGKDRIKIYENGVFISAIDTVDTEPALNALMHFNSTTAHHLGKLFDGASNFYFEGELSDVYLIDGQALTPDVFGFYKDGDGYVSVGSTYATDFRPGQWVPKRPRVIKTEIERGGGFGVNGFYLPMNDSSNPGADFHCDPNSIITLKGEDLPQPRNGAPTTTDAFVSELRQEAGTLGFDGVVKFDGDGDYLSIADHADLDLGTGDFTIEFFAYARTSTLNDGYIGKRHPSSFVDNSWRIAYNDTNDNINLIHPSNTSFTAAAAPAPGPNWTHYAFTRQSGTLRVFRNGVKTSEASSWTYDFSNSHTLLIGANVPSAHYLDGFLSNVRIIKGTALYTSNFTAPTEPLTNVTNTTLLCCNSSTSATSATVTPGTITANGNPFATRNELTGSISLAVPGISTSTSANLVTNGTFDSNVSGWTAVDATITWSNGRAQTNRTGGSGYTGYQAITVESGKRYTVSGVIDSTGTGNRQDIRIMDNLVSSGGSIISTISGTDNEVVQGSSSFTASQTTYYVYFVSDNGGTGFFDNIVVKQEDAPRDYSADIKGSGSNKTLTPNGDAGVGYELGGYYGSAMNFDGTGDSLQGPLNDSDLEMGSDDFTVEAWVNPSDVTGPGAIAGIWDGSSNDRSWLLYHGSGGGLNFIISADGSTNYVVASGIYMTTGQWYHVVGEKEGTTIRIIVNGVVAAINTAAAASVYNAAEEFRIGVYDFSDSTPQEFTGHIQDLRVYKGVAKYKSGFDVPKPYTPVGFEGDSWRTVADVTANNFATLNPLDAVTDNQSGTDYTEATHSNGNLTVTLSDDYSSARGSIGITTGKYYWEIRVDANTNSPGMGIIAPGNQLTSYHSGANGASYEPHGDRFRKNGVTSYDGTNNKTDDGLIVGVALDKNVGIISFFADGTLLSNGTMTGLNALSDVHIPECFTFNDGASIDNTYTWNFGQNPTFSGQVTAGTNADASGKGLFKYAPPSGFLALCEDNLPAPAIADPGDYMRTVIYTGDGNTGRSITGVGFQPDLVWIKTRNSSSYYHELHDSVRGAGKGIFSNVTDIEATINTVQSFDTNGFTVALQSGLNGTNESGKNYVAWCWKAGGAAVTNNEGTISAQVSANQDVGFSIVSFTSPAGGAQATVGHGLNKAPNLIIAKSRETNTYNWAVFHSSVCDTTSKFLRLNTNDQVITYSTVWGASLPTSSVFGLTSTGLVPSSNDTIAYCWAEIEGYSRIGSYVGNGSTDGPFVYCGFKPAWVMYKRTDTTGNWAICDSSRNSTNPLTLRLFADNSNADTTGVDPFDFLSNGFKFRTDAGSANGDGATYIFMAFAESPFKTANAK